MDYLWNEVDRIITLLKTHRCKILMLDFDGTLTPIVSSYKHAYLPEKTRHLLQKLSQKPGITIAIISGRELEVIKDRIMLDNIIYGAIHGLEGEINHQRFTVPIPKEQLVALDAIRKRIADFPTRFNGVLIQDKDLTVSVHYRKASPSQIKELKQSFNNILEKYQRNNLFTILAGKKVWEIIPNVNWDKGYFARLILQQISQTNHSDPLPFYIGDDTTDEDVFKKLKNGITIRVGRHHRSAANYYLKNPADVYKFLSWLGKLL